MKRDREMWTIGQIDAVGIKGPHEKELEDLSNSKIPLFRDLDIDVLSDIVKRIGGKVEDIGLGEDWTITFEIFPKVILHISYSWFGDEFGDGKEAELRYYLSGEEVYLVPGEDIITFVVILMDFIESQVKNEEPLEKNYDKKTKMIENVLMQRSEPFKFLEDKDKETLSVFLGAKIQKLPGGWKIKREEFPNISIEIVWDEKKGLDIAFSGDNLTKISSIHAEYAGISTINHVLRYITLNSTEKNLPSICFTMFSRYFTKQKNWEHSRRSE